MTIRETTLTEKEIMDAIAEAVCAKLGVTGEHRVEAKLDWQVGYGVVGGKFTVIPLAPGTLPGPPKLVFSAPETNAQRIVRETPQWSKDICEKARAEAAAGKTDLPTTENSGSDT